LLAEVCQLRSQSVYSLRDLRKGVRSSYCDACDYSNDPDHRCFEFDCRHGDAIELIDNELQGSNYRSQQRPDVDCPLADGFDGLVHLTILSKRRHRRSHVLGRSFQA